MAGDPECYGDYSVDDETQLSPSDTLDDDDVADELDRGYSPPERYSPGQGYGNTAWEEEHRETIAQRQRQEEPESDPYAEEDDTYDENAEFGDEVGDRRAGRLIDPDQDGGWITEDDLIGTDVGIDGAAASAEEAAVHVIREDWDD